MEDYVRMPPWSAGQYAAYCRIKVKNDFDLRDTEQYIIDVA